VTSDYDSKKYGRKGTLLCVLRRLWWRVVRLGGQGWCRGFRTGFGVLCALCWGWGLVLWCEEMVGFVIVIVIADGSDGDVVSKSSMVCRCIVPTYVRDVPCKVGHGCSGGRLVDRP